MNSSVNLADKNSVVTEMPSNTTNQDDKVSEKIDNESLRKNWLTSAAILAFVIFICLNAIPLGIHFFANPDVASEIADIRLNKLRQMVMNSPYEADKSGPWPWWVARAYFSTEHPDIVVMGDSQMNAAFIQADAMSMNKHLDCTIDRSCIALRKALQECRSKAGIRAVNLSLGGAMPSDYYLMSKAFFTKKYHPKLVIIGLSPRAFLDATLTSASATETFQFLAPSVDMDNLVDSAFANPFEKYFWIIRNKLTLFAYQQDIFLALRNYMTKYFGSRAINASNAISGKGQQPLASIYSGNGFISLGTNMVGPNAKIPFRGNKKEYQRRFAQLKTETLIAQSKYFNATLQYLEKIGVQVIVVDMPMLQTVRDLLPQTFWNSYRTTLKKSCKDSGASLLDWADNADFPEDEFIDYVHLNATGGKHFADMLASDIMDNYHFQ